MHLSIVIPVYNEENRLPGTLKKISSYLKGQAYQSEIIVVNDGSGDRTAEVARMMAGEIDNLRIIDNKENNGKGFAVKQGILQAKGRYRVFTDADNSTSIEHIEKAWPLFDKGKEIVIGSRDSKDAKGARQAVPQNFIKRFLGNVGNLIIQIFAVPGIWDTQCGFKCFTQASAEDIFPKLKIKRWGFDIEILFIARVSGYKKKIGVIPVYWINDPQSKVGLKGYLQVFKELFQIRWYHLKGYYNGKKR